MKRNEFHFTVSAEPGSKLERVVQQLLKDMEANRKRIVETFSERKEKQRKKIERRL